ncbi:MAG: malate dehydrogenase [Thaumarchaeota archaeon]|nr:malate dehydrogenase [Nitrososphaerota archaeon]|tara:strand:- start:1633 stop:2547 length:915 start_codon:yes stop_codon:yes gene_type:complete
MITIIGSGKVGSSMALQIAMKELDTQVLLLDIVEGLPQGEAMDISHLLSERGIDTHVKGSNEYADMAGSDIVVIVAGVGRKPGMTRMDLLNTNTSIVKDVAKKIAENAKDATIITVTNPLDPMTYVTLKITKFKPNKVIGMGNMLDVSRFKSFIAHDTRMSRSAIDALVIGEHGENMLPLIRYSSISGIPLVNFLDNENAKQVVENTKKVAAEVIALKGATIYAPANAVTHMVDAIVKDRKEVIPVAAYLDGEYGTKDVCIGVPAVLGKDGIEQIIELELNTEEKEWFDKGVKNVKDSIAKISF